jgi:hypothetical protein
LALDTAPGDLAWYFDLETGAVVLVNNDYDPAEMEPSLEELEKSPERYIGVPPADSDVAFAEMKQFVEELPRRVNRLLDGVSNNEVRLKMEVIDEGALIDGFQKIANRITLGVILAALIIGAAMLMQVQTSFTILGYPGLAMLFFLVAAGGGMWLAYSILTGDIKHTRKRPGA